MTSLQKKRALTEPATSLVNDDLVEAMVSQEGPVKTSTLFTSKHNKSRPISRHDLVTKQYFLQESTVLS